MPTQPARCPLTRKELVDEYFIENRTKVLDLAAFLDRLERAANGLSQPDFRMEAFAEALQVLNTQASDRTRRVQVIFSDPTREPLEKLDKKSARGAYDRRREVR